MLDLDVLVDLAGIDEETEQAEEVFLPLEFPEEYYVNFGEAFPLPPLPFLPDDSGRASGLREVCKLVEEGSRRICFDVSSRLLDARDVDAREEEAIRYHLGARLRRLATYVDFRDDFIMVEECFL